MTTIPCRSATIEIDGVAIECASAAIIREGPRDDEMETVMTFDLTGRMVGPYYTNLVTPGTSRRDRRKAKALARRAR